MVFKKDYCLSEKNYLPIESEKTQIILGNTFRTNMEHAIGWCNRNNGEYKKTAAFTIDTNGVIHEHFNPKYFSKFFNNINQDSKSIVILIENFGWLTKDEVKNQYITWLGDIYNEPNDIYNKKWRGFTYWVPYTEKQFNSSIKLVKHLCYEFNINLNVIEHNTKLDNLLDYNGVLYKGNLEKHYIDLNPCWDFNNFKEKIEKK